MKKWLKPENRRFNQINREPLRLNQLWASLAISKTHRNLKSQISNHKRWRWRSRSWEWKIKNKRRWRSWSWEQNIKNNMTWEESFKLHDERKWAERGTLWDWEKKAEEREHVWFLHPNPVFYTWIQKLVDPVNNWFVWQLFSFSILSPFTVLTLLKSNFLRPTFCCFHFWYSILNITI
jgi:hypothetical protein